MQKFTQEFVASLKGDGRQRFFFDPVTPGFGIRLTPEGGKSFVARAKVKGKRRLVTLGAFPATKVADARREADRVLDALKAGRDPAQERKAKEAGLVTVATLAEKWLAEIVVPKRKPRTAEDYARLVKQKIGPTFGHRPVSEITWGEINKWHASMKAIPRRANYALAVFKVLLNYAEDAEARPRNSNPARRVAMFREKKRERFLDGPEIAKAAEGIAKAESTGKIGPYAAAGLRLALFTGARSGEIKAAKWEHVDWKRKFIRLPDSKTNDARTIQLNKEALEVLRGLERVGPYIIAGALEDESYRSLTRAWIVARKLVGLDDVRLHDLRHSFASVALDKGMSLQLIGNLLGHKNARTTERYAHLAQTAAALANDDIGAAFASAIEQSAPPTAKVLKFRKRKQPERA
jgi:integrase